MLKFLKKNDFAYQNADVISIFFSLILLRYIKNYYFYRILIARVNQHKSLIESSVANEKTNPQTAEKILKLVDLTEKIEKIEQISRVLSRVIIAAQIICLARTKIGQIRIYKYIFKYVFKLGQYVYWKIRKQPISNLQDYDQIFDLLLVSNSHAKKLLINLSSFERKTIAEYLKALHKNHIVSDIQVETLINDALQLNRNQPLSRLIEGIIDVIKFHLKGVYHDVGPRIEEIGPIMEVFEPITNRLQSLTKPVVGSTHEFYSHIYKYKTSTDAILNIVGDVMFLSDNIEVEFLDIPVFLLNLTPGSGRIKKLMPNTFKVTKKMYELALRSNMGLRIMVGLHMMNNM